MNVVFESWAFQTDRHIQKMWIKNEKHKTLLIHCVCVCVCVRNYEYIKINGDRNSDHRRQLINYTKNVFLFQSVYVSQLSAFWNTPKHHMLRRKEIERNVVTFFSVLPFFSKVKYTINDFSQMDSKTFLTHFGSVSFSLFLFLIFGKCISQI